MNNLLKIQDLMREIFDDERLEISETTSPEDVAEWDSFANIQLLAALEDKFNVHFTTDEAIKVRTVSDMLALIGRKEQ